MLRPSWPAYLVERSKDARLHGVTMSLEDMRMPPEPQTAIVRLLSVIAVLLLLLVGGLGFAGYQAVQAAAKAQVSLGQQTRVLQEDMRAMRLSIQSMEREMKALKADMRHVRQTMAKMATDVEQAQAAATEASEQLAARQKLLDQRLVARSRETLSELRTIDRRYGSLAGPPPWGTFSKLDRMIGLQQVLADAILLMNEHLAQTQAISARELRPLPIQR